MTEEITANYVSRLWKEITRKTDVAKRNPPLPMTQPAFLFVKKQTPISPRWSGTHHVEFI